MPVTCSQVLCLSDIPNWNYYDVVKLKNDVTKQLVLSRGLTFKNSWLIECLEPYKLNLLHASKICRVLCFKMCLIKSCSLRKSLCKTSQIFPYSWWWWWWWIVFVVWLTDERRLALFPAGTIVGDPHPSPSRIFDKPRAGFEPAQNLSSGFVKWIIAVAMTTTPRRHKFFIFL